MADTIADVYLNVDAAGITLDNTRTTHTFSFNIAAEWKIAYDYQPILMYVRILDQGSNSLQYRWRLNGTPVPPLLPALSGQHIGTLHKVLPALNLRTGVNSLTVEIVSGTGGTVSFSEVGIILRRSVVQGS